MNILHLATTYQSLVTILAPKLEALAALPGVSLYAASSCEDPAETRTSAGTYLRVDIPRTIIPVRDIAAIFHLAGLIRKHRIDLIHTHTAKAGIVGAVAGFLTRIPVIHTYHGLPFYDGQSAGSYRLYRMIEKVSSRMRRMVFSQNRGDYNLLMQQKLLACPVVFESNGVDCDRVKLLADEQKDCVGFVSDKPKILCVARLEPVKRLNDLVNALATLKSRELETECIIAGKGGLERKLNDQIAKAGCSDCIRILYTAEIFGLMNQADLVVLVSEKEGLPRSLMEAMALGKPVVATDVPGTRELVVNGQTGVLVPLDDTESLVKALERLIADSTERRRFGTAGRERVEQEFDDRAIVDLWMDWYGRSG